jgi:hypothetical protein
MVDDSAAAAAATATTTATTTRPCQQQQQQFQVANQCCIYGYRILPGVAGSCVHTRGETASNDSGIVRWLLEAVRGIRSAGALSEWSVRQLLSSVANSGATVKQSEEEG